MTLTNALRGMLPALCLAAALALAPHPAGAQGMASPVPSPAADPAAAPAASALSPAQKAEIEKLIRDYLVANPEILQEASAELERRAEATANARNKTAIRDNADAIFNSPRQVVLGNPKGDVTLVEFFDYNCGYCKRSLPDILTLLKDDTNLRVVLKEFPVLSAESVDAAKVAAALHLQDPDGKRYLDFHRKLLTGRGTADRARALAVAREAGFDAAKAEKDMASRDVNEALAESFRLADALRINGTPSFVVGDTVIIGAIGLDQMKEKIAQARCGKAAC